MSEQAKVAIKKRLSVMSESSLKRLKAALLKEKQRRDSKQKK